MVPKMVREAASWMGRKSYRARLERLGLKRIQKIARENGKLGGRPRLHRDGPPKKSAERGMR
jgi:hypothetical protein